MVSKRMHAFIRGRVQGVGFRFFVCRVVSGLGVSGFVRNTDDGAVEVIGEGQVRDLEVLLDYLRDGPPRARVDGVDVSWADAADEYDGFFVRS